MALFAVNSTNGTIHNNLRMNPPEELTRNLSHWKARLSISVSNLENCRDLDVAPVSRPAVLAAS
jgi:hypothetical protein